MRSITLPVTALALCLALGPSSAGPGQQPKPRREPPKPLLPTGHELMQAKLKASQKLLEGLALSDFKAIASSGDELAKISQDAEFLNALKTDDYRIQMLVFRRSVETMARRAREKNLDGATLAYMDMTLTCVKCHQTTRDRVDANLGRPDSPRGGE
jgi:hypothetical protein